MKKSTELRKEIDDLKNVMESLKNENKIDDAHSKIEELKNLREELRKAEIEEEMEVKKVMNDSKILKTENKVKAITVFNKLLLNKKVTEEELSTYTNSVGATGQVEAEGARGGFLVPEEQSNQIVEYRRALTALKNYCDVLPVTTLSGKYPVGATVTDELVAFEELNEINQTHTTFTQKTYKVADYGDIVPISNTLLEDTNVNIIDYVGKRFVKKAINTENKKIIEIMKTATKKTGTGYIDITTALNVSLDPAISANAKIFTNQSSFDWLDKQLDGNNRPLLEPNLQNPTQKIYKGREIIVLPDAKLQVTSEKMEFWIGDLTQFIKFIDRKGVEIATSNEAGFTKNATLLRVIERFDVHKMDEEAMIFMEITPAKGK